MQRAIVQPADLGGAALDELKQWLGISRDTEDAQLTSLLQASLELCEAFIGQLPIEVDLEERVSLAFGWQNLASKPVRAITGVDLVGEDGSRTAMVNTGFEIDIDANSTGRVRISARAEGQAAMVICRAGIATDWQALPDALRQGIIRLAAFHYRDRDTDKPISPPASIAALWRPWRLMRLV